MGEFFNLGNDPIEVWDREDDTKVTGTSNTVMVVFESDGSEGEYWQRLGLVLDRVGVVQATPLRSEDACREEPTPLYKKKYWLIG